MKKDEILKGMILPRKIEKIISICCLAGIFCCILMMIPHLQLQVIFLAEKMIIHRLLVHSVWIQRFIRWALTGINIFILILLALRMPLKKYDGLIKGFFVCIFLLVAHLLAIIRFPARGNDGILSAYLLSYRYGFASRMFIGTIIDLFSKGWFISRQFINTFILCSLILLCFSIAIIFGLVIQKSKDETKLSFIILFIIYLSSPISPIVYFTSNFFGRMELYVLLIMLITLSLIDKNRWGFIIPLSCFISIASHLVVVFFYIPIIFIVLLYKLFSNQKAEQNTKYVLLITTAVVGISFVYFVLFSRSILVFQTEEEFLLFLKNKTDISLNYVTLHFDYFLSINEILQYAMSFYRSFQIYPGFYTILQTAPLFLFFMFFWRMSIKIEQRKPIKMIFLCSSLLPILSVPAFILFIDWGRWLIMIFTAQFMLVFYFLYRQENSVVSTAQKIVAIIGKNYYAAISLMLISSYLGTIDIIHVSDNLLRLISIVTKILKSL